YLVAHGRTGLLSSPGDPEALATNVIRVLNDPQLAAQLALNAQEQCKRYTWNAVRPQWLAVYQSMMDSSRLAAQGLDNAAGTIKGPVDSGRNYRNPKSTRGCREAEPSLAAVVFVATGARWRARRWRAPLGRIPADRERSLARAC